jgi:hypothetical protein
LDKRLNVFFVFTGGDLHDMDAFGDHIGTARF